MSIAENDALANANYSSLLPPFCPFVYRSQSDFSFVAAIIETGRQFISAKADLKQRGIPFERLFANHPEAVAEPVACGQRTAQRLMNIADNPVLSNATHASLLPSSWMTLFELTNLSDDQIKIAIEERWIRPDMDRKAGAPDVGQAEIDVALAKAGAAPLHGKGRPKKGEGKGDDGTFSRGSNSSAYLAARIQRDHPEIAGRLAAGLSTGCGANRHRGQFADGHSVGAHRSPAPSTPSFSTKSQYSHPFVECRICRNRAIQRAV
jgi:hypothetical protein